MTHDHAGFDALASLVAATKIYPGSYALAPENMQPDAALFIDHYGAGLPIRAPGNAMEEGPAGECVVVVAGRRRSSLGALLPLVERAREVHIFDHHPPSPDDLEGSEIRVEPVGAVTTLLVEEIRRCRAPMSELENSLMLLGIYRDTASLSSAATTPRDAAAVAFLWEQSVDTAIIGEYMRAPLTAEQESLLAALLGASELFEIAGRRVLIAAAAAGEAVRGLGALARRLQQIEDVDLLIILTALPRGALHLEARSTEDDLDLPLLLAPLGARGYRRAVSAGHIGGDLAAFRERLLELLERYLPPPAAALDIAGAPAAAAAGWSVNRVREYLDAENSDSCPVVEEEKILGMITRKELQQALRSGFGDTPVQGFVKRRAVTLPPQSSITALRRTFVEQKTERIILTGDEGEPLGEAVPMDVLRYLYRLDGRPRCSAPRGSLLQAKESPPPDSVDNLGALLESKMPPRWQSRLLLMGQRAAVTGVSLYLVGGAIRDLLLGAGLSRDLDFIVVPDAVAFAGEAVKFLGGKLKVFEHFGTASLFLEEGLRLDFATARREIYAAPAALPQVEGTSSLKSDLYRRDFTINTLACSLLPQSFGELYDFFEGREDLRSGVIRTLYHLSFVDDPLRVLRAVRFEQRFGFRIEEGTLELIEKALRSRVLDKVSRRRLAQEISLIYEESDPASLLMRLQELNILEFLYPRLSPGPETWQRLNRIGEALAWAEQREWSRPPEKELVYLSGLFMELEEQDRLAIIRRLGLSRDRAAAVLQGCRQAPALLEELSGRDGAAARPSLLVNRLDPLFPETILLLCALSENRVLRDHLRLYLESLRHVRPRLRGGALKELGLQPGPLFGEILGALRRAVLDGELRSYDEELDFVTSYLERLGGDKNISR